MEYYEAMARLPVRLSAIRDAYARNDKAAVLEGCDDIVDLVNVVAQWAGDGSPTDRQAAEALRTLKYWFVGEDDGHPD